MFSLFGAVTEYILDQSLQIGVLFGVVGVLCFLLRRASSHVRYLLWGLVIAKCIFPSVMKVSLAVLPEKEIVAAAQPVVEPEIYAGSGASVHADFSDFGPAVAPVVYKPSFMDRLGEIETIEWVGIVWAFGAVLFLAGVCFRAWRLNRRLRSLRRVAELDFCVPSSELIDLWQIDGIGQPFVWGLWRGSVYVPGNFSECGSVGDQRGILMHEFAHVRRFDAGVNVLQIIAQGLFWFHPLVWFANTMVRREREKCCDEAAIANLKTVPRDYGNAIIDTLAREYESDIPVPSLAVAGPVKNIEDRLKTIMRPGKKFYTRCGVFTLVTILLLAMFALPVGCVLTSRSETVAKEVADDPGYIAGCTKAEEKKLIELRKEGHALFAIPSILGKEHDLVIQEYEKLKKSHSLEIADETERYGITLIREEKCKSCPNGVKFGFTIVDKKKKTSSEFIFNKSAGPDTVYNIKIWKNKAAILGKRGNLDVAFILRLDTHEVIDIIWAFRAMPSPSGRFISYVKFISRGHYSPSDVVLVYDLDKTPAKNRLAVQYLSPKTDIGFPVFPKENVEKQSYELTLAPERHNIASRFLWTPNEKRLLFLDLHDSKTYLVSSDLSNGIENPVIRRKYIDPKLTIKQDLPDEKKEYYRKKVDSSSYRVSLDLSWSSKKDVLVLRPNRRGNDWQVDEILMPLP